MIRAILFLLHACLSLARFDVVNAAVVVNTPSGLISGWIGTSQNGREYTAFTKVPFAKPPVGPLRFQNPVPYGRWNGVYKATDDPKDCSQITLRPEKNMSPDILDGTEDCLYLNVYVPNINKTNLPVIVSVFGGGFIMGGIGSRHNADNLMDEDIIFVAMNYRVGPLGFMSLEDEVFPGNFGLKDQALAVQWTKNNIASFGGDPDLITILGVSAGGASSHHLMLSPLTRDLIKGGVTVSGTANKVWSIKPPGLLRNRTISIASVLGCDMEDSRELLDCMQKLEAWKIVASQQIYPHDMAFAPTVEPEGEGSFMPVDPTTYRSEMPWFVTFTNGERLLKYNMLHAKGQAVIDDTVNNKLDQFIGVTAEVKLDESIPNERRVLNKIKARYLHADNEDKAYELGTIFEDVTFVYPALDALQRHAGPIYFGRFECDVEGSKFNIAAHASEQYILYKNGPEEMKNANLAKVSKRYLKLIADFAKYQNPMPDNSWTQWQSNEMMRLTCDKFFMGTPEDYIERENVHGFWKGLFCDSTLQID